LLPPRIQPGHAYIKSLASNVPTTAMDGGSTEREAVSE
jgi:hypothetical protein